jgi:Ca2+-binding EF-hand superfamily protein
LKDIFDRFDRDKSGKIERGDLEAIMNSLKRDPKEGNPILGNGLAENILNGADPNHDGTITFEEFLTLMSNIEQ